jgi:hypothetical protein
MAAAREHADPMPSSAERQKPSNEYVLNVAFFSFFGFVIVQVVFALIARSEAMLADSEAMMVDALTYLLNLMAERIKNRPLQESELAKSATQRHYDRELQRLYLELVPPSISVLTLVAVTCMTLREASTTLRTMGRNEKPGDEDEESVSLPIMLVFSAANLLLDIVNVSCFARANMNFGLDMVRREQYSINEGLRESSRTDVINNRELGNPTGSDGLPGAATEATALIEAEIATNGMHSRRRRISSSDLYHPEKPQEIVNLNMCSAWTVSSALSRGTVPSHLTFAYLVSHFPRFLFWN